MMSSSEADIPRGGFAHLEHRRPDGWTSTPCGKDDDEASSQSLVRTGGEGSHGQNQTYWLQLQLRRAGRGATAKTTPTQVTNILKAVKKNISLHKSFLRSKRQVLSCYNSAVTRARPRSKDKEKQETTYDAATKNDESVDKDAEIMRLIEERRKLPKEEKHRLKELSKKIKKLYQRKKW